MTVKPSAVFFLFALAALPTRAAEPGCVVPPDSPLVRLAGVDAAGDPLLEDGRRLRLLGLAPSQDETEAARFSAGLERWRGRDLKLVATAVPDRWSRLPARLVAEQGIEITDLAAALASEGAARRLPEPGDCARPASQAGAALARVALAPAPAQGDWLDGHDLAALRVQAGRIVGLRGRIISVGERARWTYLNFSRRRGEAASVAIDRGLWRTLQEQGWTSARLVGKAVTARGVLGGRDGLLLEVTSAAALELTD